MNSRVAYVGVVFAFAALFVLGCAKPPEQEITAAQAALQLAKDTEADKYAPDQFKAAQDTLDAALAAVEAQKSKFALARSYKGVIPLLEKATTLANTAKEDAITRKEEIRQEIINTQAELQAALQEAKELMAKAPRGKEGREALEMIQNELTMVEASLNEVTTLINSIDYYTAKNKIDAAMSKITSINDELKEAYAKKAGSR